ncbi:hypothetical protein BH09MYX1_BH09MYX1_34550 [soil metagenome]
MRNVFFFVACLAVPFAALACGGGGSLEGKPADSPTATASGSAVEAKIKSFDKSADMLKVGKIGGSDGALKADGSNDAAFSVEVEGSFLAIFVVTTDAAGKPDGNFQWDTLIANEDMPSDMKGLVKTGGMTGGVGVFENGQVVNKPDGSLPPMSGSHKLDIYISNVGAFVAGSHFQLLVEKPDHTMLKGPVATF